MSAGELRVAAGSDECRAGSECLGSTRIGGESPITPLYVFGYLGSEILPVPRRGVITVCVLKVLRCVIESRHSIVDWSETVELWTRGIVFIVACVSQRLLYSWYSR